MGFKGKFCIPNQTKKFSFFYKLDRIIVLISKQDPLIFNRDKMHCYSLILGNGKTVFKGPFFLIC